MSIQALLCGFLAFEGFINFVGEEIAPEAWDNERRFFSKGKYRGIGGKIEYLFTKFPGVSLDKESEAFRTYWRLKETRDSLAHNRVYHYSEVSGDENPSFKTYWEDFDTVAKVEAALQKLKGFAELIRLHAVKVLVEDYQLSHLHFPAFGGPLAHSEGTTAQFSR